MIEFEIPLNITSALSANKIYAGVHWSKRAKDKKEIAEAVQWALIASKIPREPLETPVEIEMLFNSQLDCSNHSYVFKIVEDALESWVIHDDTKKYVRYICMGYWDGDGVKVKIHEVA